MAAEEFAEFLKLCLSSWQVLGLGAVKHSPGVLVFVAGRRGQVILMGFFFGGGFLLLPGLGFLLGFLQLGLGLLLLQWRLTKQLGGRFLLLQSKRIL